jgi:hypothetical protein
MHIITILVHSVCYYPYIFSSRFTKRHSVKKTLSYNYVKAVRFAKSVLCIRCVSFL